MSADTSPAVIATVRGGVARPGSWGHECRHHIPPTPPPAVEAPPIVEILWITSAVPSPTSQPSSPPTPPASVEAAPLWALGAVLSPISGLSSPLTPPPSMAAAPVHELAENSALIPANTAALHGGGADELAENSALIPANTAALHGGGADELAENLALIPANTPRYMERGAASGHEFLGIQTAYRHDGGLFRGSHGILDTDARIMSSRSIIRKLTRKIGYLAVHDYRTVVVQMFHLQDRIDREARESLRSEVIFIRPKLKVDVQFEPPVIETEELAPPAMSNKVLVAHLNGEGRKAITFTQSAKIFCRLCNRTLKIVPGEY